MPPTTLDFDTWLREVYVWPASVPRECTRQDRHGEDCLARNKRQLCDSCAEFSSAAEAYENDREGTNNPVTCSKHLYVANPHCQACRKEWKQQTGKELTK